jgi:MFS family permease
MSSTATPRAELIRGLAIVYVPSLFVAMAQTMIVPLIPFLSVRFEVAPGVAAQVITSQILGRVLSGLPSGVFVDRFGPRTSLIIGAALLALSSIGALFAPTFWLLLAAQFLAGVGGSLWLLARELATIDLVAPSQRGRAMSGIFGLTNTGSAMGPVVGGFLLTLVDFHAVFILAAVIALVSAAIGFGVLAGGAKRSTGGGFSFALTQLHLLPAQYRVTYVVLILGTFAAFVRMQTQQSILPLLMVNELGYTEADLAVQFSIIGAVTLGMIAPSGFVSDHIGRKAPSVLCAACAIIMSVGYFFATGIPALSVLSIIAGIATGFGLGAMTTYTYDIVPTQVRGQFQSFRRAAGDAGSLCGPALGGAVATFATPSWAMLSFMPLHLISMIALLIFAKETLRREARDER